MRVEFRTRVPEMIPALLLMLSGCGVGPVGGGGSGPVASHGGTLLELPNKAGHVELIVEKAAGTSGRRVTGKVLAFFTDQAGAAALDPAPTDVAFIDEDGKRHPLAAKAGETSAARFESEPFPTAAGEPTGTLEAKVGGEAVKVQNRPR